MIDPIHAQEVERLRRRLERIEEEMLDSCPFCTRYRELEEERAAVARRLRELYGVQPR